jgi:FKBP-type peptidyl-prolyl cis-trans isomerase
MKILTTTICALLGVALLSGCSPQETAAPGTSPDDNQPLELSTKLQRTSYSLGVDIATNLQSNGFELDLDSLVAGLTDGLTNAEKKLSDEEIQTVLLELQKEMMEKMQQAATELAEKNLREGREFLARNKEQEGVVALESGLQYRVITEGSGPRPQLSDTVSAHYRGRLIDGTEFDSSYSRGKPATFPVKDVIPGWTEALQLMKAGSKWELFIPPELAYGAREMGRIGPNSTLIFEVELLEIK